MADDQATNIPEQPDAVVGNPATAPASSKGQPENPAPQEHGPWEDYAKQPTADEQAGPWTDFQSKKSTDWSTVQPMSGPAFDEWFSKTTNGKILHGMGQGGSNAWGAEPLGWGKQSEDWLKNIGVFDDYKDGQSSVIKQYNEAFLRPLAVAADAAWRTIPTIIGGAIGGAEKIPGVGPTIAQGIEALIDPGLAASVGNIPGLSLAMEGLGWLLRRSVPPYISKAHSEGIIGDTEAGYQGMTDRKPVNPDIAAEAQSTVLDDAAEKQGIAPWEAQNAPAPKPHNHKVDRQQNPALNKERDD